MLTAVLFDLDGVSLHSYHIGWLSTAAAEASPPRFWGLRSQSVVV